MTDILFCLDTEDFTSNHAADAIRDEAEIFRSEGVRACFFVVGLLARQLMAWGRNDVLAALSHHEIGAHSYGHTLHPTINEYTDVADFDAARNEVVRQETLGHGYIRAATGTERIRTFCPPGNQKSYVAMYAYADMGASVYADTFCDTEDCRGAFYCDLFHVNYSFCMEDELFAADESHMREILDRLAHRKRAVIYTHPHKALYSVHWDQPNYYKENLVPFGRWIEPPRRPPEETETFYRNMRRLVRLVKADPRFRITSCGELADELARRPVRTVTRADVPALRSWIAGGLRPTEGEGSLSLTDLFHACRALLSGAERHVCGRTRGFLEAPRGLTGARTVTGRALRESACALPADGFLPPEIWVDGAPMGPADWLRAALDVLAGAEETAVRPGPQLPSLDVLPQVRDCAFAGEWCQSDAFRDRYLSDRLRWQSWTMRW